MKPTLLILALAACLTFAGDAPQVQPFHRYIITAGTIERDAVTLKLDTATGRTWLLYYAMSPNKERIPGWLELEDDLGAVQNLLKAKAAEKAAELEDWKNYNPITKPTARP